MTHESTAAFKELLTTVGDLDRSFLEGDRAVSDDRHIADGYRMLAATLGVAFDTYLFTEPGRPQFVAVNTPFRRDRRWGALPARTRRQRHQSRHRSWRWMYDAPDNELRSTAGRGHRADAARR